MSDYQTTRDAQPDQVSVRQFSTSLNTDALDAAIAKAQGDMDHALKKSVNPGFVKSGGGGRYADLTSVIDACREALSKHGISVTQWPVESSDGRCHLITRVAHNGQWMLCRFSIPVDKQTAHGYGSALTYLRRYSLAACLGITQTDDDANEAIGVVVPHPSRAPMKVESEPDTSDLTTGADLQSRIKSFTLRIESAQTVQGLGLIATDINTQPQPVRDALEEQWFAKHDQLVEEASRAVEAAKATAATPKRANGGAVGGAA